MSVDNKTSSQPGALDVPINYESQWPAVRDDINAYNQFIGNLGIVFKHYVALPYVIGVTQDGGLRNYDEQKVETEGLINDNGFIYKYVGDVYGIFQSNNKDLRQLPAGYYADSVAYVTFNKFYKGTDKKVSFAEFDKLIPCESPEQFWTVNFQSYVHNPTGIDRLQYKASEIEFLYDSTGKFYSEGVDFKLTNGYVEWLPTGSRPGIDNTSGQGRLCGIRYKYMPYFYVKQMVHELRTHATFDQGSGAVKTQRGPIQCAVQVDWVFLDSLSEKGNALDAAQEASSGGNTGPR